MLPAYVAALEAGWSPANIAGERVRQAHLAAIAADAEAFLASLHDPEAAGPPIALADGSLVARLPGYTRWIAAGGFAGVVHLRWQPGTEALPPHVAGHIGYAVVPERRGEGIATRALGLILAEARGLGLGAVTLTVEPANLASVRVILRNGGVLAGVEDEPAALGGRRVARYRIALRPPGDAA